MALQVGVGNVGARFKIEPKGDRSDDITATLGRVEDAAAIGEATLLMRESDEGHGFRIVGADSNDRACDLLAIGTNILHGSSADGAGNSGEAFDTADSLLADMKHKGVPIRSGGSGVIGETIIGNAFDGVVDGDVDDKTVKASIADEQVAASPEDEDLEAPLARKLDGIDKLIFA